MLIQVNEDLSRSSNKLATLLKGSGVSPEKFREIAFSTVRKNQFLHGCTPTSIVMSILEAAQYGLTIGGQVNGEAYIVPYGKLAQLQVGYKGMRKLALRSPTIARIEAHVVYEGEEFKIKRTSEGTTYIHEPDDPFANRTHDKIVGAYAIAFYADAPNSNPHIEVLSREQIEFLRGCSKMKNGMAWKDHFDEMARKSVIRRLCKHLPLDDEVQALIHKDEMVDLGLAESTGTDRAIDVDVIMGDD